MRPRIIQIDEIDLTENEYTSPAKCTLTQLTLARMHKDTWEELEMGSRSSPSTLGGKAK